MHDAGHQPLSSRAGGTRSRSSVLSRSSSRTRAGPFLARSGICTQAVFTPLTAAGASGHGDRHCPSRPDACDQSHRLATAEGSACLCLHGGLLACTPQECYDTPLSGHLGRQKMAALVSRPLVRPLARPDPRSQCLRWVM